MVPKKVVRIIFALFFTTNICGFSYAKNATLFKKSWGQEFQIKRTENGEPLTVSAIASYDTNLYLYDLSDRSLIRIGPSGTIISKVILQSIGRSTYTGDDFIVHGTEAIFLNAVDFRLEYFDCESGNHLKSVSYPRDLLGEKKRSRKIINRIFLDGNDILLGNSHVLVFFSDLSLAKKQKELKIVCFPENRQIIFYHPEFPIHKVSGMGMWAEKKIVLRKSAYFFTGKSIVLFNGKPVQCVIDENGIEVFREE